METDRHERWSFWQCDFCGYIKTFPHPPAGPRQPLCTYGHHRQPMHEVVVRPWGIRGSGIPYVPRTAR